MTKRRVRAAGYAGGAPMRSPVRPTANGRGGPAVLLEQNRRGAFERGCRGGMWRVDAGRIAVVP